MDSHILIRVRGKVGDDPKDSWGTFSLKTLFTVMLRVAG